MVCGRRGSCARRNDRRERRPRRQQRETFALAKAYSEAGNEHTALVDTIVAEGPSGVRFDSPEQLREEGTRQLSVAAAALYETATAKELDDYRAFVLDVAHRVAAAHREAGETISTNEQAALDGIAEALAAGARPTPTAPPRSGDARSESRPHSESSFSRAARRRRRSRPACAPSCAGLACRALTPS